MHRVSLFSTSSPALFISCLFNNSHVKRCEVTLWFWLTFPWWWVMLSTFSHIWWSLASLLWKKEVFQSFSLFKKLVIIICSIELHDFLIYFVINPLSDIWLANTFSHSIVCLFILLIVCFTVHKCFSLMWSYMCTFALVVVLLLSYPKNHCPDQWQ